MSSPRLRLLGLIIALVLVALAAAPSAAHAFVCRPQPYDSMWVYYSDASMTTIVGTCENDCGTCWCSGMQRPYYHVSSTGVC